MVKIYILNVIDSIMSRQNKLVQWIWIARSILSKTFYFSLKNLGQAVKLNLFVQKCSSAEGVWLFYCLLWRWFRFRSKQAFMELVMGCHGFWFRWPLSLRCSFHVKPPSLVGLDETVHMYFLFILISGTFFSGLGKIISIFIFFINYTDFSIL